MPKWKKLLLDTEHVRIETTGDELGIVGTPNIKLDKCWLLILDYATNVLKPCI